MTREEAKERLQDILEEATTGEEAVCYVTSYDEEAIKMAIKALEEPQWIPCSVKYPDPDERVLVTIGGYDYYVWDCMSNRGDDYFWEDEEGLYHNKYEVVAWMPLPEPYKKNA